MRKIGFIIFLAALAALAPFSTDIYLSSMPLIMHAFSTSIPEMQLTLSLFFIGYAFAQLFWGPISDRYGRKPVLFIGVIIFLLSSLGCALSHSIGQLIALRILQAIGACSGIVMVMSIVKDTFPEPKEMSKVLSIAMGVMILAPMVAPILGGYLLVSINWQANFYFLFGFGVLVLIGTCFISESYPQKVRRPLALSQLFGAYLTQAKKPAFLYAALAAATSFSTMFAFISASPFVYIKIYHVQPENFGYYFAINATSLLLGTFSVSWLKRKLSDIQIAYLGGAFSLLGAFIMFVMLFLFAGSIWSVVIPACIATYGVGMLFSETVAHALKYVVAYTGLASSVLGTIRFSMAAVVSYCIGLMIHESAVPLAITMFVLSGLTLIFMSLHFKVSKKEI